MATCRNTSRISSRVTPLLSAPLTCTFSSWGRLSALIIARLIRLRVLSESPSRPQHHPQQYSVASSCIGMLKSSAVLKAFSTNSLPSTAFRISSPLSNVALSMVSFDALGGLVPFGLLAANLHSRPLFDHLRDAGEIGRRAVLRLRY